ncbi:MAG: hypothetical protein AAF840_00480 [Bacteroidota bacterium]
MPTTRQHNWPFWLLTASGFILWGINWWAARPLFLDEANVARNVFDRNLMELFIPLDYQQYAPPLYLVLVKICGELLGYGERALRLPSLLGGGLAWLCLSLLGRQLKLGYWSLLLLALLFFNPFVLQYVGELKPYALDLGIATLLLYLSFRWPNPSWRWALVGSIVVWCSLPSVFLLAALPFALAPRADRSIWWQWAGVVAAWLSSFGLLFWLVLEPSIKKTLLTTYHVDYFFPLPTADYFSWEQVFRLLEWQPKAAIGFTALAIIWGLVFTAIGAWASPRKHRFLYGLPLLGGFAASSLEKYSLIPRLMLFSFPAWCLLAATGTQETAKKKTLHRFTPYFLLAGWCIVIGSVNTLRHYISPLNFSDARRLTTELPEQYQRIIHESAIPGYDYYQRIHPRTANLESTPSVAQLQEQTPSGQYVVLYDVLTAEKNRRGLRQDSTWAVQQGATDVRVERLYRSARLYVTFPAKE